MFERLDAVSFVEVAAVTHGMDSPRGRAIAALGVVDLDPAEPKPIGSYSKGMRQRVKLATALVLSLIHI